MLEFRVAAAAGNLPELERLFSVYGDSLNINEPGSKSGKTAAHVAANGSHFKVMYWLLEKGANFYYKDSTGKTAFDYLQQNELASPALNPQITGDRQYFLCNAHYKIWLAHDPSICMPYLYQDDFREYRKNNPNGHMALVYSAALLSDTSYAKLLEFAQEYQIKLISFENDLEQLTTQFGTETDKLCYRLASYELSQYPNQGGGNLAVVADLIRWSTVLLRIGSYSDTDVDVGQHKWAGSIPMAKAFALNLGTLVDASGMVSPWINGDIIAVSSLLPQPLNEEHFRIVLPKAVCSMIEIVQLSLLSSCHNKMKSRRATQQSLTRTFSDLSSYLKDLFQTCGGQEFITGHFSSDEIKSIQADGLESLSKEKRASIIERMANWKREAVEKEYDTPDIAHQNSKVFQNVGKDDHELFLVNYMHSIQMTNIKEGVKQLSGTYVFNGWLWECIKDDEFKLYSIYSHEALQSAFRSTNTFRFDTTIAEQKKLIQTTRCADLSFTFFGMASVLKRSQDLAVKHQKPSSNTLN